MKEVIDIDEGLTYDYVIHGLVMIAIGVIISIGMPILGIPIFILGILVIGIKSGVQIDIESKRIRKYSNTYGYKSGSWTYIGNMKSGTLELSKESGEILSRTGARSRSVKSFDLILISREGKKFEFHSFTSYSPAKKISEILTKKLNIPIDDIMARHMLNSLNRKRR